MNTNRLAACFCLFFSSLTFISSLLALGYLSIRLNTIAAEGVPITKGTLLLTIILLLLLSLSVSGAEALLLLIQMIRRFKGHK